MLKEMPFEPPNREIRRWIDKTLTFFPYVKWDRFYRNKIDRTHTDEITVFGWIDRENDSYKDFITLVFYPLEEIVEVGATSSAKYSKEACEKLGAYGHNACHRCEDYFRVQNCIRLRNKLEGEVNGEG